MSRYTEILRKITKNKIIYYILSRYATYAIQFINSLIIAVYLGPYYLGIWGFITLILQYLNQINLGIAYSVNAIVAIHKNKEWYVQKVIGVSFTMLTGLSILVILFFSVSLLFGFNIGDKYEFSKYAPIVVITGILGYFNVLLSNIYRIYGRLFEIAFNQTIFPVLMLVVILFFKGQNLLLALVITNCLAFLLSFVFYLIKSPVKIRLLFIKRLFKKIQVKGWYLFVYNTSFYLIMISTRSFISGYYSINEFGYFTFAFTLAHVVLLLLESFSFIIYPKMLNRLSSGTTEIIDSLLEKIRSSYITTSHLLIHIVIVFSPLFFWLFPQYEQSKHAFRLISLTLVLYTNSFGYSGLLIAKGKEKVLGYIALGALFVNVIMMYILTSILDIPFTYVILGTMFTYFFLVFAVGYFGRKILCLSCNIFTILKNIFPIQLFIPYILSLCLVLFQMSDIYFAITLILFLICNYKIIISLKKVCIDTIFNPRLIDI
jgi:O-antigen/teichoic acid export membrane protein